MRRSLLRAGLLAGLAVTACGPTIPLMAGLNQTGVDVFFGRPAVKVSPPPSTGTNPLPNFPAPLESTPFFNIGTPPIAADCAPAPPFAFPAVEASTTPPAAPAPASYTYRFMASERIGGQTLTLPEVGVRQVRDVSTTKDPSGSQSFSFTVVQSYGGQQTSMSFDVIPEGPAGSTTAGTAGSTPLAGLYLTQMKDDSGNVFSPNPAIQLMPFPAVQGATYPSPGWEQGSGTDPLSATTMSLTSGLVKSRDRVNACGVVLDSWQVEVQGTIGSAFGMGCPAGSRSCGQQKTFDLTFDAATQYGGLLIYDHLKEIGSDAVSGKPFAYDIAATIDQKPLSR